jgi:hypothetical protein
MGMQSPQQPAQPLPMQGMGFSGNVSQQKAPDRLIPLPFVDLLPQAVPFTASPNSVPNVNNQNRPNFGGGGGIMGAHNRGQFPGLNRY